MNVIIGAYAFTLFMFLIVAIKHYKYIHYSRSTFAENEELKDANQHLESILPDQKEKLNREWKIKTQESVDELRSDAMIAQTSMISQALSGDSGKELQSSMKTLIESTYSR
jgi:hypothetical protein